MSLHERIGSVPLSVFPFGKPWSEMSLGRKIWSVFWAVVIYGGLWVQFSRLWGPGIGLIASLTSLASLYLLIFRLHSWKDARRLRRRMRELRPKVERHLDAMIRLAEQRQPDSVYQNEFERHRDKTVYRLQLLEPAIVDADRNAARSELEVRTLVDGKRIGWMNLDLGVYIGAREITRVEYPAMAEYAPPEQSLLERITRLRALVGEGSELERLEAMLARINALPADPPHVVSEGSEEDADPPSAA